MHIPLPVVRFLDSNYYDGIRRQHWTSRSQNAAWLSSSMRAVNRASRQLTSEQRYSASWRGRQNILTPRPFTGEFVSASPRSRWTPCTVRSSCWKTRVSSLALGSMRDRTRFDANTDRHHHFVCCECGMIGDFYSEVLDRFPVPREVAEMGSVDGVYVELRGRCRKCQGRAKKRKTR